MRVEIRYDPTDEIDPAAAYILADEVLASDQFDREMDTLVITPDASLT